MFFHQPRFLTDLKTNFWRSTCKKTYVCLGLSFFSPICCSSPLLLPYRKLTTLNLCKSLHQRRLLLHHSYSILRCMSASCSANSRRLLVSRFIVARSLLKKTCRLFELRGSSWFQENPLGIARFVQIS